MALEADISQVALKSLLIYLEVDGVIKFIEERFKKYRLKYIWHPDDIVDNFEGEKRRFVKTILDHSVPDQTWATVDIDRIVAGCDTDRQRVITALEYFRDMNWIDLRYEQMVEVFEIWQNWKPRR